MSFISSPSELLLLPSSSANLLSFFSFLFLDALCSLRGSRTCAELAPVVHSTKQGDAAVAVAASAWGAGKSLSVRTLDAAAGVAPGAATGTVNGLATVTPGAATGTVSELGGKGATAEPGATPFLVGFCVVGVGTVGRLGGTEASVPPGAATGTVSGLGGMFALEGIEGAPCAFTSCAATVKFGTKRAA